LNQLGEDRAQIVGCDLPKCAQDSPFLEEREAEAALFRIRLALQVASPDTESDLGFHDAGKLERITCDLGGLEKK
jgi:hypothetical protein